MFTMILLVNIDYDDYLYYTSKVIYITYFVSRSTFMKKIEANITDREKEVLSLLADGYSNEEAAELLNISRRTVEAHRSRIMLKLNAPNITLLVKYALKNDLTKVDSYRTHDNAQATS